ncbi:MAG: hypothetical protein WC551_12035 [Patescibacteria group bacterium]
MKLQFLTGVSSSEWGAFGAGEMGEVPDEEAKRLIAAGYAEPVGTRAAPETADKKISRRVASER